MAEQKRRTINLDEVWDCTIHDVGDCEGRVDIETEKHLIRVPITRDNIACFANEMWRFVNREQGAVDQMKRALSENSGDT